LGRSCSEVEVLEEFAGEERKRKRKEEEEGGKGKKKEYRQGRKAAQTGLAQGKWEVGSAPRKIKLAPVRYCNLEGWLAASAR
jgi:hypothetical protein